jgi:RHS repeat-associated protein
MFGRRMMFRRAWPRCAATTAVVLLVGLLTPVTAAYAADPHPFTPMTPRAERSVPAGKAAKPAAKPADPAAVAAARTPPAPAWPSAASASVDLASGATDASASIGGVPVRVAPGPARAGHPAVRKVSLSVLDHAMAAKAGINGIALRISRADGATQSGPVQLTIDTSTVANAFGADWASRLRAQVAQCGLTTPAFDCAGMPVPFVNDARHHQIQVTLDAAADPTAPVTPTTAATSSRSVASPVLVSPGGHTVTMLTVTSGPSGDAGDFTTPVGSGSLSWAQGGPSGDFAWSYPIRTPPGLGGPVPNVALSYSAQSVDGRTAASNNQPSWIGEGFDYSPGFITRNFKACADDMGGPGANNTVKTGDLCWAGYNATLTLGGQTTELIKDSNGAWQPVTQDGSKAERITTGGVDYWRVTAVNGTQYFFGREQLPGWSAGMPQTNSLWKVSVAGNNTGDPCYVANNFAGSFCDQPWRWNLDYVLDVNGNSMSFWYTKESNDYGRNLTATNVAAYTRGGYLTRIDYGTDDRSGTDTEYVSGAHIPATVQFTVSDRCLSSCTTHDGTHWPDTPWDQSCAASPCTNLYSPTFWSTKRLTGIKTQVWGGSAARDVESWTLTQSFPDPGDGSRAGLWLTTIGHQGLVGATVAVPDVTFTGIQEANRVDGNEGYAAMNWWRVATITTETGAVIAVTYSPPECVAGHTPAADETNNKRCFPTYWTPPGAQNPVLDWFQKYRVDMVTVTDNTGGTGIYGSRVVTSYTYPNPPAWRHVIDAGIIPVARQTWSDWRGYDVVGVTTGDGVATTTGDPATRTYTQTTYLRGLDGDQTHTGGARSVTVPDGQGNTITDSNEFAGMALNTVIDNGPGGSELGHIVNTPWRSTPKATRTIGASTIYARYVGVKQVDTYTQIDGATQPRHTQTVTTFNDADGTIASTDDEGDLADPTDDRCTTPTYAPANTNAWIKALVQRTVTVALPCGQSPTGPLQVLADTRVSFDGQAYGATPAVGDITKTETLAGWSAGTSSYVTQSQHTYDAFGRIATTTNLLGVQTATTYATVAGGGVNKITNTTTATGINWVSSTDIDPAWGASIGSTDLNGKRTDQTYDALGRLTAAWIPGRTKGTDTANTTYAYNLSNTTPSTVAVSQLLPTGSGYATSYTLYDALLRRRQTQQPSATGSGRIITDTFYDTAGRAFKTYGPFWDSTTSPGTTLFPASGDASVPTITLTQLDGASRPTSSSLSVRGVTQWTTTTTYHGDRVDTVPPPGGTATTTLFDAHARAIGVRDYKKTANVGSTDPNTFDLTSYTYNPAGQLSRLTDAAGNHWDYTYDIRGRLTEADDPDTGRSTVAYNASDQTTSATNSRTQTLAYVYDSLGRITEVHDDNPTGAKRISYTYDGLTGGLGLMNASSRWIGTNEYRTAVTAVDADYRPTTQVVSIPASEGFATSYTFKASYTPGGAANTLVLPAAGDLGQETLSLGYTAQGLPQTLTGTTTYVTGNQYTPYGESDLTTLGTNGQFNGPFVNITSQYEDGTHRLHEVQTVRDTTPSLVADDTYTYDPAGLITKQTDATASDTDTQCFTYDYAQHLTSAWTPNNADCTQTPTTTPAGEPAPYWQEWQYDNVGQRTQQIDQITPTGAATTAYTRPTPGTAQPHPITGTSTKDSTGTTIATAAYSYDASGNTTSRPGLGGTQTLSWDVEGHLTGTMQGGTPIDDSIYDTGGNRLVRHDANGTTLYLPDGVELHHAPGSGTITQTRYYTFNGQTIATRTSAGVTWLIADPQGTATSTIAATATQPVAHRRQTPYGAVRTSSGAWPTSMDKGFVGGTQDPTGTTHLGARDYDPTLGQFLSADPLLNTGDPQQINGYSYAGNDPVSASDPTGLIAKDEADHSSRDQAATARWEDYYVGQACPDSYDAKCKADALDQLLQEDPNYPQARAASDQFNEGIKSFLCGLFAPCFAFHVVHEAVDCVQDPSVDCAFSTVVDIGLIALGGEGGAARGAEDIDKAIDQGGKDLADEGGSAPHTGSDDPNPNPTDPNPSPTDPNPSPTDPNPSPHSTDPNPTEPNSAAPPNKGAPGPKGCNSFRGDTKVVLANGTTKDIDHVTAGDAVLATDPDTGETEARPVLLQHINQDHDLADITIKDQATDITSTIHTTARHPFWSTSRHAWVTADYLLPGENLLSLAGAHQETVTSVRAWVGTHTMYNLTIGGTHTYYVLAGSAPVLVHNTSPNPNPIPLPKGFPDVNSMYGADPESVLDIIPGKWTVSDPRNGTGIRFSNPDNVSQTIIYEEGWPGSTDPVHSGPYLRVSTGVGPPARVPLAGNPAIGGAACP